MERARSRVVIVEGPPAKIGGRYLAPFLAKHLGLSQLLPDAARDSALPVEIELTPTGLGSWSEL